MEEIKCKYLDVVKMQCTPKEIKVTKRSLETTIEMAGDYSKMLLEVADKQEREYDKAFYKYKAEEVQKIADDLTEKIGYCKSCKVTKNIDDVGMDAFELMGHRNKKTVQNAPVE